jgi:nucleoside-diphosphate-sugar epimerase
MKILVIGGTGLISTAVVEEALQRDLDVYILNRGHKALTFSKEVKQLVADIHDHGKVKEVLKDHIFDVIIDFIAFTVDHVKRDYELFKDKTTQYIFISSASAYQKPLPKLPITEDIPLDNPYWQYSQNKKHCETYLLNLHDPNFKVTIIRPSHTYNDQSLIFQLKSGSHPFTLIDRMLHQKRIILPDDGNSKWTLTYHKDFSKAFVDIIGNEKAYNEFFHLTSEKVYTWKEITHAIYDALNVKPNIVYIPTEFILKHFPEFEGELYGDKYASAVFDNSKIKNIAPNYTSKTEYPEIAKKAVNYYMSHVEQQTIDEEFIKRYEKLIKDYQNGDIY